MMATTYWTARLALIAHWEVRDMAEHRGEEVHDGLLIRGSDGSLWFMRDDAKEPERLGGDLADSIRDLLDEEQHGEFTGLPPRVQELLSDRLHLKVTSGIVFWRTTRPPR
jgi:hypothetical protein